MRSSFEGKDIMVTGGCGSVGSEIVRHLLEFGPKRIRVFDSNESGLFRLQQELGKRDNVRYLVGDVRDRHRVKYGMKGVDTVFHAAALKHVPLCEYNPFEAVQTNVLGTQNLVEIAREEGVGKFIGISTDKAVNPINTMGATKLLSEKLVINASMGETKTLFSCVRFGNVLNSDGSVIPIFKEQIRKGGPVTLTSEDMTRFFMTMPDAVNLILKSSSVMRGREIFILKMKSLVVKDLAEVMINELAGKSGHSQKGLKISIIGRRPEEKMDESLITEEEALYSEIEDRGDTFVIKPSIITPNFSGPRKNGIIHSSYSSRNNLLSKDEIRNLLLSKNII